MEPVLTLYDEGFRAYADVADFDLDLAFGADENDFTLTVYGDVQPVPRGYIGIVGTEYGGVIDAVQSKREGATRSATYSGRTWHGILDSKVLCPDSGQSHITVGGAASDVLASLIDRMGLGGRFYAYKDERSPFLTSTAIDRYTTGWAALQKLLAGVGCRCALTLAGSAVEVSAVPLRSVMDDAGGAVGFDAKRDYRPINHLVGLGSGELSQRVVTHWYADADGNVSQRQTLFGVDERAAVYDYNNAELDELNEKSREKLVEMQDSSTASVEVEEATVGIGDTVTAHDDALGIEVTASVSKIIAKVSDGVLTVDYETGDGAAGRSLTGTAESSGGGGGGASYVAGEGIAITGGVISADVTESELGEVRAVANAAKAAADSKADASHGHKKSDITDFPSSMPASDVSAWAKAASKPSYTASEVGAAERSHTHPWADVTGRPSAFPPQSHTHPYAGASSAGGAATSALKLSTARTITLTGAVSGSASFDGSRNVTISTTGGGSSASEVNKLYENDYWRVVQHGGACTVFVRNIVTGSGSWDALNCKYTVPANLRPATEVLAACMTQSGDGGAGFIRVKADGTISVGQYGGTGTAQPRFGQATWIPGM